MRFYIISVCAFVFFVFLHSITFLKQVLFQVNCQFVLSHDINLSLYARFASQHIVLLAHNCGLASKRVDTILGEKHVTYLQGGHDIHHQLDDGTKWGWQRWAHQMSGCYTWLWKNRKHQIYVPWSCVYSILVIFYSNFNTSWQIRTSKNGGRGQAKYRDIHCV